MRQSGRGNQDIDGDRILADGKLFVNQTETECRWADFVQKSTAGIHSLSLLVVVVVVVVEVVIVVVVVAVCLF